MQTTAHLGQEQKEWLAAYAASLRLGESELLRILIEKERRTRWLEAVLNDVGGAGQNLTSDMLVRWLQQSGS